MMERVIETSTMEWVKQNGKPLEIIRCSYCDASKRKGIDRCHTFEAHGCDQNGFCAWPVRLEHDQELSPRAQKIYEQLIAGLDGDA